MNYHKNLETIARGKGSPQARYDDRRNWDEAGEWDIDRHSEQETKKGVNRENL